MYFNNKEVITIALSKSTRLLLFISFIIIVWPKILQADEFKILSFTKAKGDISAINMAYRRTDANDDICAIIKVRSDIKGLGFEASNPIVGDVEWKNGEYWVYLSERTRELSVFADGFIRLSYTFPQMIEKAKVYVLKLSSNSGGFVESGKGSLLITSIPSNAQVSIDGFPDLNKKTPCSFDNYRADMYRFNFHKNRYFSFDTLIRIEKDIQKQININLVPTWGNLIVNTNLNNVEFEINNKIYAGSSLNLEGELEGLNPGTYSLKISKTNYKTILMQVVVLEAQAANYNIVLEAIKTDMEITSFPSGAEVFIDGEYFGKTPLMKKLIIGPHTVKLVKDSYLDEIVDIKLLEDKTFIKNITLRNHMKIQISSTPSGAKVYINGEYKGKTPLRITVKSGPNNITLKKENYQLLEQDVDIGNRTEFNFRLLPEQYTLKIGSRPKSAEISINGAKHGQTPKEVTTTYGRKHIRLNLDGYFPAHKNINLNSNQNVNITMSKRLSGYLGMTFTTKQTDYDINKFGSEIGWTYKKAPRLLTGIGFLLNYDVSISESMPSHVIRINIDNYPDMHTNTIPKDGFAEENTYLGLIRFGLVIPKPFVFVLGTGLGWYKTEGIYAYESDKNYTASNGDIIHRGDLFYGMGDVTVRKEFIYSVNLLVPISMFYLMGEYWISNNFVNFTPEYSIGIGYSFDN